MPAAESKPIDRLAIRSRPPGSPIMHQSWENLLFLHWPMNPELIRPLIPARLTLETFDGQAWIGITPFQLTGLRPVGLPAIPFLSSFYELNVRTYVHLDGVPGLWFFTLYASKALPVAGARLMFSLPYRQAEIQQRDSGARMDYALKRGCDPTADFEAHWQIGDILPSPALDSLEFFLVERYCLYAAEEDRLFRCRVYHVPWQLRAAKLMFYRSNLIAAEALHEPAGPPLVHYGGSQNVEVWPLEEV